MRGTGPLSSERKSRCEVDTRMNERQSDPETMDLTCFNQLILYGMESINSKNIPLVNSRSDNCKKFLFYIVIIDVSDTTYCLENLMYEVL